MMGIERSAFKPKRGLRNRHVQSLLASAKWRLPLMRHRLIPMLEAAVDEVWSDGKNVVLHSLYARQKAGAKQLVILIHGWEGSHESVYMRSAASSCFAAGYDVLCLNLRDHGPSHSFNEGLFHAQRLDETIGVIQRIMRDTNYAQYHLCGFSLGGNFALRVAAALSESALVEPDSVSLSQVLAVCPVVDPSATFAALEAGPQFYTRYFMKKWKRSLNQKVSHFPELMSPAQIEAFRSLKEMTDHLVTRHTQYESLQSYFDSYRLTPEQMRRIRIPSSILWAKDDPVIPFVHEVSEFAGGCVRVEVADQGGHCGFVEDFSLRSYIDQWMLRKIA